MKLPPKEQRGEMYALMEELEVRNARKRHTTPGGLFEFVKDYWSILEPETPLVDGWALFAVCEHLEAVTRGDITRLLINVPPGFMKSLLVDVFWPAWEWGPMSMPHLRYVAFSYSAGLTERDNGKFRDLICSPKYRREYGHVFSPRKIGEVKVTNNKTGSKLATSVGGIGTGERGDRIILDDPHNIKEGESEAVRGETVRWFREALSNRLNNMATSVIVVIMQRVHEADVSGCILENEMPYVHLMIPMEYDPGRHCETVIGWSDPRSEDGELAWEERFPEDQVADLRNTLGPYAYAGQYQQAPAPRGGGIIQRDWWQLWESQDNSFPPMEFILVSVDSAYTEKEQNDPTGCTVWGLWRNKEGQPRIMLMHAWRKWLKMNGKYQEMLPGETKMQFVRRTQKDWGLVEWVAFTAQKYKADKVIVEAKASGLTAVQELERLYGTELWGTEAVPVAGDKVARAHGVSPIWSQLLVYAPDRDWADMVIDEMATFPKGRYKDLTDTATQAVKFLRDAGMIVHRHEIAYEENELRTFKPNKRYAPLYPC
jgi:predicted phage terminase large subunit-like protein